MTAVLGAAEVLGGAVDGTRTGGNVLIGTTGSFPER